MIFINNYSSQIIKVVCGFKSLVCQIEKDRPVGEAHGLQEPNARALCQRHITLLTEDERY